MANILVTGAYGQLGNEMRILAKEYDGFTYYFTDADTLDICDKQAIEKWVSQKNIDVIVNCAAYTAVDNAEDNKELADQLNHLAPGYLAEVAQKYKAAIIHISTDYVFNGKNYIPYKESDPTYPASVYGATKLAGEKAVMEACEHAVIIRTSWLYSAFGNNFVKTMIRLGKERESLGVIFDQVGTPTYAEDLALVILRIIQHGIERGIYHYSNEGVCSWYDFAESIHNCYGGITCELSPLHTSDYPTKAARPHYSVLDKTKIKETFDIDIPYWTWSLEECIRQIKEFNIL